MIRLLILANSSRYLSVPKKIKVANLLKVLVIDHNNLIFKNWRFQDKLFSVWRNRQKKKKIRRIQIKKKSSAPVKESSIKLVEEDLVVN